MYRYCNSVPVLQSHLMNTQLASKGHTDNALHPLCMCLRLHPLCGLGVYLVYIFKQIQVGGVSFMVMALLPACQTFNVLIDRFPLKNKLL